MRTLSYHSYRRQKKRCQRGLAPQKTRHLVLSLVCVFPCGWLNFLYCSSFILFVTLFVEFLIYTAFWSTVAVFKSTKSSQIVARKKSMLYYVTEQRKALRTSSSGQMLRDLRLYLHSVKNGGKYFPMTSHSWMFLEFDLCIEDRNAYPVSTSPAAGADGPSAGCRRSLVLCCCQQLEAA